MWPQRLDDLSLLASRINHAHEQHRHQLDNPCKENTEDSQRFQMHPGHVGAAAVASTSQVRDKRLGQGGPFAWGAIGGAIGDVGRVPSGCPLRLARAQQCSLPSRLIVY
jgi:hypothetical protein